MSLVGIVIAVLVHFLLLIMPYFHEVNFLA